MRGALRAVGLTAAAVIAWRLPGALGSSALLTASLALVFAIAALSVVVITGWAGQVSLAQVGFMGVGAYVMARLMDPAVGMPVYGAVPCGVVAAAFVSLLVGLPAVRLRGIHLTIVTLAVGQVLVDAVFSSRRLTGSANGLVVARPVVGSLDLSSDATLFRAVLVVLVLSCLAVAALRHTTAGRSMIALSAPPAAVAARGIDITASTLGAVALSAALAGLAGCCLGLVIGSVGPASFTPLQSALLLALVVLVGARSISGAVVAGVVYATLPQMLPRLFSDPVTASRAVNLVAGGGLLVALVVRERAGAAIRRAIDAAAGRARRMVRAERRLGDAAA